MRKVIAGLFHSIDGVVEAPNLWQFDAFDAELGALMSETIANIDAVVIGRKGYEEWASFWPTAPADMEFKDFINAVPKFVASRTLKGPLGWQNSTLIDGDLETFVRDLKAKAGKDIGVMASISVVRQLFLAGLMDELTLITHPVIAGTGYRHLFNADDATTRLTLEHASMTSHGNVVATYTLKA